jgi:hypothetical protein
MENAARKQFLKWHAAEVKEKYVLNFQKSLLNILILMLTSCERMLRTRKQF